MRLLLERGFSNYSCLSSLTYPVPAWGTQLMECSCELKKPFYLWQQGPQTCDYMEEYITSQNKRQPTRFSSQGMVGRGKQDGEELRAKHRDDMCSPPHTSSLSKRGKLRSRGGRLWERSPHSCPASAWREPSSLENAGQEEVTVSLSGLSSLVVYI